MKPPPQYLAGALLPTVVTVALVMLTAMLGLLSLWELEQGLFAREQRLRQARADVESAAVRYYRHPDDAALTAPDGCRLYDSLPRSRVYVRREPWGLYELLHIAAADSLAATHRIAGLAPEPGRTLYYADDRAAVTLAGDTHLHGVLHLPQRGLSYGRMGSDFYRGTPVPAGVVRPSGPMLPQPDPEALRRIEKLFLRSGSREIPDSLTASFRDTATLVLSLGTAEAGDCTLRGRILLVGDEVRIDSTCRWEHLLVAARKITVGRGTRIAAQLFARDTLLVEPRAVLEYPSGLWSGCYAEMGDRATADGYVIVRDTAQRKRLTASYRQARTARVRGLLYVEGVAQLRGIVAGRAVVRRAACFTPQGYYKDMLYDLTLLENPATALPLWEDADARRRRKEVVCVR